MVSGGGDANSPHCGAENRKFYWAGVVIFLLGEENLRRSDFDNLNLSQSFKQVSVNTYHQNQIMTCEYEIKTMELLLLGYYLKIVIWWG